jgi:hypothetical protein
MNPVWLRSTAQYRLPSPDGVIFEPMTPVHTIHTEWAKGQPCIELCDDPNSAPTGPTKEELAALAAGEAEAQAAEEALQRIKDAEAAEAATYAEEDVAAKKSKK